MTAAAIVLALVALVAQAPDPVRAPERVIDRLDAALVQRILRHGPLEAPAPDPSNRVATSDAAARLGQTLFFDQRLSLDGTRSCASCHVPSRAFADGLELPEPAGSSTRHTPSLLNAAHQRWFFWDGRADSLWSQALQPLENERELGIGRAGLARLIARDAQLVEAYRRAFDEAPSDAPAGADRTAVNAVKAIAAYETRLVSGESAFDRFARALRDGDRAAQALYPEEAARGLLLFVGRANCRSCHAGPLFSDGEFHSIGMPPRAGGPPRDAGRMRGIELLRADPFRASGAFSDDPGGARAKELESLMQSAEQWGQVRTPTLRNVSRTAPYMHQGQKATLADVLRYYSTLEGAVPAGHHGETVLKPLNLTEAEMRELEAFLRTLEGEDPPAEWGRAPPEAERKRGDH